MAISSVNSIQTGSIRATDRFAAGKKAFGELETALKSGNLSDAKTAFADLQKNAPPQANNPNNPLQAKFATLGKALDSGDLNAARTAFADIKQSLSNRANTPGSGGPPPNGPPNGPTGGGRPPHGGGGEHEGKGSAGSSNSSSSNQVYDVKDVNKDGKVSLQELLAYELKHPETTTATSASSSVGTANSINTLA